MATWAELTTKAFGKLSLPLNTTGDVKTNVENALWESYLELITDTDPVELLVKSSFTGFTNAVSFLSISSDFLITDLATPFSLAVNEDPTVTGSEPTRWKEMSWQKWIISQRGYVDSRDSFFWTISPDQKIYFSSNPSDGESWDVDFYYYRNPTAFSSVGSPDIHEKHDDTIVNGAVIQFPEYFSGDRAVLFQTYSQAWGRGLQRFQNEKAGNRSFKRIRPRGDRLGRNGLKMNWGS